MSVHDLCCIGYITQDKIVTTKNNFLQMTVLKKVIF